MRLLHELRLGRHVQDSVAVPMVAAAANQVSGVELGRSVWLGRILRVSAEVEPDVHACVCMRCVMSMLEGIIWWRIETCGGIETVKPLGETENHKKLDLWGLSLRRIMYETCAGKWRRAGEGAEKLKGKKEKEKGVDRTYFHR